MTLAHFFVYSLATWRIASLLVLENGPWSIFFRLRELSGIEHDQDGNVLIVPDKFFSGILSCVWCCSMWVAFGWTMFWMLCPDVSIRVGVMFGFSAVAILIDKFLKSA